MPAISCFLSCPQFIDQWAGLVPQHGHSQVAVGLEDFPILMINLKRIKIFKVSLEWYRAMNHVLSMVRAAVGTRWRWGWRRRAHEEAPTAQLDEQMHDARFAVLERAAGLPCVSLSRFRTMSSARQ